jgi:transcription elongation factor GreA
MSGVCPLEQAHGMKSARPTPAASVRGETIVRPDRAHGAASALTISASEFGEYEQQLGRLRAVQARDLPDRFRQAREYVGADAAEDIAHIREDSAVIDARIARLEDLVRTAIVVPDGRADGAATLGCTVEVAYERTGCRASYRLNGIPAGGDNLSVSARSPVGRALTGGRAGDVVSVDLPSGRVESIRIVAIIAAPAEEAA